MHDKKYWILGMFFIFITLNVLNMSLNKPNTLQYLNLDQFLIPYTIVPIILAISCFIVIKKKKEFRQKQEKIENILNTSLEHEDTIQHDENEKPVTYVDEEGINLLEHEDAIQHDNNDDPVPFVGELDEYEKKLDGGTDSNIANYKK
jgi:hypothetical protein